MEFIGELWLPIVVAAALVFVVSSVIHMCTPMHKADHGRLPKESEALASLRHLGISPGWYVFPCPDSMKDMGSADMLAKYKSGPCGFMTVLPTGVPAIGKALVQWFVYSLILGVFVAYVASFILPKGEPYMGVFRLTSVVAFMGYGLGVIPDAIWKGASWKTTFKFVVDALLYGLATGGAFGWLWPR